MSENKKEMVNHPEHYQSGKGYEVMDIIDDFNLDFCLGNAIKYILRAGKKDPEKKAEDLDKAIWYIKRANKTKEGKIHSKYIKCMSCGDYFPPENDDDLICENCKEKYVDEKEIEDSILFYPWLSEDQIKNTNNKGSEINE